MVSSMLRREIQIEDAALKPIAQKVFSGERLSFEDGVALYDSNDLLAIGHLANHVPRKAAREPHLFQRQPSHQSHQRLRGQLQAVRFRAEARRRRRLYDGSG